MTETALNDDDLLFDTIACDAVTVSPKYGWTCVAPFGHATNLHYYVRTAAR